MFTGIIRAVAQVKKSEKKENSLFLEIQKPRAWKVKTGDSVAVNGTCLTVKKIQRGAMVFELMPETLSKTIFGVCAPRRVNLEQSLRMSDRLDGHFVMGHVDAIGKIADIEKRGASNILEISFPRKFAKLVVPKGSIAVDGISLTIVDARASRFSVSLVSYTLEHTTLGEARKGDLVNLEFDMLAKYVTGGSKRTI